MENKVKLIPRKYLLTFILVTSLFALWGFANDITNPMVAAFQTVMELTAAKASMVQFAFYGGYATMAIPAALFIRHYSYKKGILLGFVCSGRISVHSCSSTTEFLVLLPVIIYPYFWIGLFGDYCKSVYSLVRRQVYINSPSKHGTGFQSCWFVEWHGSGILYCIASIMVRQA